MKLIRQIGTASVLIETNSSRTIYFEESFIKDKGIKDLELSAIDICLLLSEKNFFPLSVSWEITDKCNFSCPFCYIVGHSQNKILRFSEIKPHISKLIEKGMLFCVLTGGEATSHPDFKEIYTYLKENGVFVEVYTNASLVSDEIVDLFSNLKPYKLEITLYGISNSTFIKNTKSSLKSSKILENILKLKEKNIKIKCKTPLNKLTIKELPEIKEWCKENNIDYYYSTNVVDAYDNSSLQHFQLPKEEKIYYDYLNLKENNVEHIFDENPIKKKKRKNFTCGVGRNGIAIDSGFNLKPCKDFFIDEFTFSILELGVEESLNNLQNVVLKHLNKDIKNCTGCRASELCKLCPALAKPLREKDHSIKTFSAYSEYCNNQKDSFDKIKQLIRK